MVQLGKNESILLMDAINKLQKIVRENETQKSNELLYHINNIGRMVSEKMPSELVQLIHHNTFHPNED